jgi:hypothetical protein
MYHIMSMWSSFNQESEVRGMTKKPYAAPSVLSHQKVSFETKASGNDNGGGNGGGPGGNFWS